MCCVFHKTNNSVYIHSDAQISLNKFNCHFACVICLLCGCLRIWKKKLSTQNVCLLLWGKLIRGLWRHFCLCVIFAIVETSVRYDPVSRIIDPSHAQKSCVADVADPSSQCHRVSRFIYMLAPSTLSLARTHTHTLPNHDTWPLCSVSYFAHLLAAYCIFFLLFSFCRN